MKLFLWDEIGCEISDREMPDLPLAGRHLIGAANGWLWAESDDSDPGYDAEHETTEDGVECFMAHFGRDKEFHIYLHPTDPAKAKAKAELDLSQFTDGEQEDGEQEDGEQEDGEQEDGDE
jgi:hypothetical protein